MINPSHPPVPVTILTGFLGAGKTTLLNRILRGTHDLRIAVLVNDFGAINVDAQLVVSVAEDTISLSNGCICCTIRDDLLRTVLDLLRRAEPPEAIVIECSGVSDPVAVAQTFLLPQLRSLVRLDSIITVVDAEQARDHDEYADLITDQIAAADIVIINKVDLASPNLRAGLRDWVQTIVPAARILEAMQADVPVGLLLPAKPRTENQEPSVPTADGFSVLGSRFSVVHPLVSWSYISDRPFAFRALQAMLQALPTTIYRAKGVLYVAESPTRRVILHLVGQRVALSPDAPWGDEPPRTQLVLIGTTDGVDADDLQWRFDTCLAELKTED